MPKNKIIIIISAIFLIMPLGSRALDIDNFVNKIINNNQAGNLGNNLFKGNNFFNPAPNPPAADPLKETKTTTDQETAPKSSAGDPAPKAAEPTLIQPESTSTTTEPRENNKPSVNNEEVKEKEGSGNSFLNLDNLGQNLSKNILEQTTDFTQDLIQDTSEMTENILADNLKFSQEIIEETSKLSEEIIKEVNRKLKDAGVPLISEDIINDLENDRLDKEKEHKMMLQIKKSCDSEALKKAAESKNTISSDNYNFFSVNTKLGNLKSILEDECVVLAGDKTHQDNFAKKMKEEFLRERDKMIENLKMNKTHFDVDREELLKIIQAEEAQESKREGKEKIVEPKAEEKTIKEPEPEAQETEPAQEPMAQEEKPFASGDDSFEARYYKKFIDLNVANSVRQNISSLPQDAVYRLSLPWTWMSDATLNGQTEKWLAPITFIQDTPGFASNPLQGQIASDCSEQANTLVSLLRAQGTPAEQVRVVLGKVNFGGSIGGHAWVELWHDGKWMALDPTTGAYYDDAKKQKIARDGVDFTYWQYHPFPALEVWAYYNDQYYKAGSGGATAGTPSSWDQSQYDSADLRLKQDLYNSFLDKREQKDFSSKEAYKQNIKAFKAEIKTLKTDFKTRIKTSKKEIKTAAKSLKQSPRNFQTSAVSLVSGDISQVLSKIKSKRDTQKEEKTKLKYLNKFLKNHKRIPEKAYNALNNFIAYGVDDNSKKLGEGERAAVIASYKAAFEKLPETEDEIADAIRIANGRWPVIKNEKAEAKAKEEFQKIYQKIPDMQDPKDNAAVTVMAYGLRQKAENRNLESEKQGIKIFKNIYGRHPSSTKDWNAMQAITYSGASRSPDSDKDLLPDAREKKLGTDPNNPDTDADGYKDGEEVLHGFDPLSK